VRGNHADEGPSPTQLVAASYDEIHGRYVEWGGGHAQRRREAINDVLSLGLVPRNALAVDLGCGTGRLATAYLVEQGLRVTGVDISAHSIAVARGAIPQARFIIGDMTELHLPAESVDLVTAFYSIIHVPRELHGDLFAAIAEWLRPGGVLVASLAARASEKVMDDWLGAPMYWSSWDASTNERLVGEAGLDVISADIETSREDGNEVAFQWLRARKRART
jgi:SAM-dependent methyltransferase